MHVASLFDELDFAGMQAAHSSSFAALKNHMSSLFDDIVTSNKQAEISATNNATMEKELSRVLGVILEEIRLLSSATPPVPNAALDDSQAAGLLVLNLETELALATTESENTAYSLPPTEGWRWLGAKRVWKSDWTEYDQKNLIR